MTQGFFMRASKIDQTGRFFDGRTTHLTKPTKWSVRPAKTQISLGIHPVWSESSLPAWRSIGSSATHFGALQRFWSDWTDAQADLGLRWAHSHFVGFVMRRLILLVPFLCVMQVSYLWTDIGDIVRWSQYTAYTGHVNDVTFHLTYITDSFLERKSRWKQLQLQWP